MVQLTLNLLGRFEIAIDATPVTDFRSDKVRALLAYLALEPQPHSRRVLAALFWPEIADKHALTNLRNTLHRLRQSLDAATPGISETLLAVTRHAMQFKLEGADIDVNRFQTLLDVASARPEQHQVSPSLASTSRAAQLTEAVALYQGELLAGFSVGDAPAFEEWLLLRRELLHQRALLTFATLVAEHERAGSYEQAYAVARRLLALDAYREDIHRQAMRLLAQMGQPDRALQHFEQMRQRFHEELGDTPAQETLDLVKQIAAGEVAGGRPQPNQPAPAVRAVEVPQPPLAGPAAREQAADATLHGLPATEGRGAIDLSEVPEPGPFFGREPESRQITKWLLHDRCRVVAILGIGGMGKTSLAATCVRDLAGESDSGWFDFILWRSLLNAPLLEELLPPLLQILSDQQVTDPPKTIDEQLRLFLRYLREQRVLLVLDNMESILDAEQAGAFRNGYESYGQLIQQIATRSHQSHLLLTSRERPRGYARLEGDSPLVRSLHLAGLEGEPGRRLLAQRGLHGAEDELGMLIARYSGNPLALKLVADTVDELFGGDIVEFLAEEGLVFDDLRAILDQQFARLTSLEQDLLFWLAVEREVTPVPVLRKNLLETPAQRSLVEALRSLQRRSLIERQGAGFTLQNVIIEYLTDRLVETAVQEFVGGDPDLLQRLALLKAQSTEYVRQSQARLILAPIGDRLVTKWGTSQLTERLRCILEALRSRGQRMSGYAAGNILNLLLHLNIDVTNYDFSRLSLWQVPMQGIVLHGVDFSYADLAESTLTANFGRIKALAISPDSTMLALGTDDGEVRLWRLADGQLIGMLRGHRSLVESVAFSPDSRYLVSSSPLDEKIYLWQVESGDVVQTLQGHRGGVEVVCFSPDGTMVASGGRDCMVRLWDVRSGEQIATLAQHPDWVVDLAFHPNRDLLVSCCIDRSGCYLWQRQDDRAGRTGRKPMYSATHLGLLGHEAPVRCVTFSPDGALLATGGQDATVRLWNLARSESAGVLCDHRNVVRTVVFSRDGTLLVSSGDDFIVCLWDVASGRLLNMLHRHRHQIWDTALSGDGRTLATGGSDGLVRLWRVTHPQQVEPLRTLHGYVQPIYALAVSPNGNLFATGEQEGRVRLWQMGASVEQTKPLGLLEGHSSLVDSLAFSPDGRLLVSGSHDKTARLWDVATGKCVDVFSAPAHAGICIAVSPHGNLIACGVSNDIHLWERAASGDSRVVSVLRGHTHDIRRVAFSPDGRYLASCSSGETVRLWDILSGECIQVFGDAHSFWSMTFSPDGALLAGGGRSGIYIWDLHARPRTRIASAAMADIVSIRPVSFSPDGKLVVSGGIDRRVRVWDLENDVERHTLTGHAADVTSAFFLPDGDAIISAGYDGTVRLWDARLGVCRQIWRIPGPYEGMNITGVTGISEAQREALMALGAVEEEASKRCQLEWG